MDEDIWARLHRSVCSRYLVIFLHLRSQFSACSDVEILGSVHPGQ